MPGLVFFKEFESLVLVIGTPSGGSECCLPSLESHKVY